MVKCLRKTPGLLLRGSSRWKSKTRHPTCCICRRNTAIASGPVAAEPVFSPCGLLARRSVRALGLFFLSLIPQLRGEKPWELPQLRDGCKAFALAPGFIGAGVDGLNRYINDPWLALTDTVIPGP